jgi:hypothetical protein
MVNKSVYLTLALAFFSSSLAVFAHQANAAPIVELDCSGLSRGSFTACVSAKYNFWTSNPANYYCKKVNGSRATSVRTGGRFPAHNCDLRNVVDHR